MNKILVFFLGLFLLFCEQTSAQNSLQLSDKAQISVLTCGPGNVLYTTFGHSAIRVYDPEIRFDRVYNYGTFDFNAPNFYLNFAKGKLTYMLSVSKTNHFLTYYNYENRWVKAQLLNLKQDQKQAVFNFLENNAKPQNRNYQYDFFFDNCSTKIEEVLQTSLGEAVVFTNDHITSTKTHRDLIEDYTADNEWGKFGIDLALGAVIDVPVAKQDYKFLPDYMYLGIETATLDRESGTIPLSNATQELLNSNPNIEKETVIFTPFVIFSLLGIFIVLVTYKNSRRNKRSRIIDVLLFLTTGIVGIVVVLLWFATDHTATYENYNFLWAFPLNFVVAFYLMKSKLPLWLPKYLWFLNSSILGLLMIWASGHQIFNIALIPLLIALTIRYYYLILYVKRTQIEESSVS